MPVAVPQTMPKSLEELPQQSKWKKPIEFVRMDNIADATERDIFLHQKRRVSELPKDETLFEEQRARLDAALVKLKSGLRIPFILTFVSNVLTDQDIAWIAEQAGRSPTETATMIEAESAVCHKSKYALSSQFIADLLGIQPDTVSQRVRRARLQLAALLGGAP